MLISLALCAWTALAGVQTAYTPSVTDEAIFSSSSFTTVNEWQAEEPLGEVAPADVEAVLTCRGQL